MTYLKVFAVVLIATFSLALSGCCCGGDAKETTVVERQPVSVAPLGEELIKLKEAHEKGALTDQEYETAKKNLLKE